MNVVRTSILLALVALLCGASPALANSGALSVYKTTSGTEWATTGNAGTGDTVQTVLGFLQPTASPGTVPLYECLNSGLDRFLSLDSGCEGRTMIDTEGYIYDTVPSDQASATVYRCNVVGAYHFASTSSDCGGHTVDGPLGDVLQSGALELYDGPSGTVVTTGEPPSGYTLAADLGYVVSSAQSGQFLYQCLNGGTDYFLSIDDCEGQEIIGVVGAVYSSPPSGLASVPLYRCSVPGSYHFASNSSTCSGQNTDGLLGYTLQAPLPVPTPPTPPTPPSPPTQTTPVSTTVTPKPLSGRHAHRALRLHVVLSWTWQRDQTRLRAIALKRAPRHVTVTISCSGRGCPRRARVGPARSVLHRPAGYRAGDRVTVVLSATGYTPERIRARIRYGAVPRLTLL